jgi:hypothetical protein
MAIRHLIAAALTASACAAHADVIPSTTAGAQSSFLSGWTTGDGTNVMSSGVLSNNVNLIGGVAYGSSASADALLGKASSSLGSAGGATKLFYTKGVEGMYLLGAGHGVLAAMIGNGVSVVGSNGGVLVTPGVAAVKKSVTAPVALAASATAPRTATAAAVPATTATTASAPAAAVTTLGTTVSSADTSTAPAAATTVDSTATSTKSFSSFVAATGVAAAAPLQAIVPTVTFARLAAPAAAVASVPEPSTIALMLAGLIGAGALSRRRR